MNQLPQQQAQNLNWFRRNPGKAVALIAATVVAFFVLFAGSIFFFVFGLLRNSGPAKLAIARSQSNPAVVQYLGQPIRPGFFVSGSENTSGPSGHAELSIPVSGPKAKGTIYLITDKNLGLWSFSELVFAPEHGSERINLMPPASGSAPVPLSQ